MSAVGLLAAVESGLIVSSADRAAESVFLIGAAWIIVFGLMRIFWTGAMWVFSHIFDAISEGIPSLATPIHFLRRAYWIFIESFLSISLIGILGAAILAAFGAISISEERQAEHLLSPDTQETKCCRKQIFHLLCQWKEAIALRFVSVDTVRSPRLRLNTYSSSIQHGWNGVPPCFPAGLSCQKVMEPDVSETNIQLPADYPFKSKLASESLRILLQFYGDLPSRGRPSGADRAGCRISPASPLPRKCR